MNWIWFLLIGAIAGWLAGQITRGRGFGLFGDIVIGIVGALVGGFVFSLIGLQSFGNRSGNGASFKAPARLQGPDLEHVGFVRCLSPIGRPEPMGRSRKAGH